MEKSSKTNFSVWGKARQRAIQATPHPIASRIRGVYTWREHDSRMQTRNPDEELVGTRRKGGGGIMQNLITHQRYNISTPFFI
jgi:hypothetical protein